MVVAPPHPGQARRVVPLAPDPPALSRAGGEGRRHRRWLGESRLVPVLAFAVYFAIAMLLDFRYEILPGDAMSRMANGYYVLFSRDPHLAAIGFVWTPLTSLVDMAFLLFKGLWPPLVTHDVAGSLTSCLAMAGAVYQVDRILYEWRVRMGPRVLLAALFAVNPMVAYYSANGMSEAMYLFTLCATTRYLMRWLRDGHDTRSLVYAAAMLAVGFLARNEAVAAAAAGGAVVVAVSFRRAAGSRGHRSFAALTDTAVFLMPFAVTFAAWAVAGYVLTGQLLAQFKVNALQVQIAGVAKSTATSRLVHEVHALANIAPLLPMALALGLLVGVQRRNLELLAVGAVLGGSLAFSLVSYLEAQIFPWFRFYIMAVPLEVLLVGAALAGSDGAGRSWVTGDSGTWRRRLPTAFAGVALPLAVVGPSLPTTARAMLDPVISPETTQDLGFVFHAHPDAEDRAAAQQLAHIVAIGRYVVHLVHKEGSVVVDNADSCMPEIVVTSAHPKDFVIPNDRDFQRVRADPLTFGARYLLVPQPTGLNSYDAVSTQYPGLFDGTQHFVREVHRFPAGGLCPEFRLFRVVGHPTGA
jgi:hypothetical protein